MYICDKALRYYFQEHHIEVLSNQPIRKILKNSKKSGGLAKWAIKLGEHDIDCRPQTSIKAQAVEDFLTKIPDGELKVTCNKIANVDKDLPP